jgi:hypothetical protein
MSRVHALVQIALSGLARCYDAESGIFHAKLVEAEGELRAIGRSFRYSGMAAIGLTVARQRGLGDAGLPLEGIRARLVQGALAGCDPLDLALVLWAEALDNGNSAEALLAKVEEEYWRLRRWHTGMGLSWMLAAVEHAIRVWGSVEGAAQRLADEMAADLIRLRNGRTGLFRSRLLLPTRDPVAALSHRRVATFANQIYPIYALSLYATRTGDGDAARAVRGCVEAVCGAQGERGQWWWMADTKTGRWVDRFPVYAVHQDAMAPFGLDAARAWWPCDVDAQIRKGLDWLFGDNELGVSLVDERGGVIWRAIQRSDSLSDGDYGVPPGTLWRRRMTGLGLGFLGGLRSRSEQLVILRECRTYHLGWVLFASEALERVESSGLTAGTRQQRQVL